MSKAKDKHKHEAADKPQRRSKREAEQVASNGEAEPHKPVEKLTGAFYEEELKRLQFELVRLQYWAKERDQRIVIIFEGRDAAGKGGMIKRITEPLNPRGVR